MSKILLGKYHAFPLNFRSQEDKSVLIFSTKELLKKTKGLSMSLEMRINL